MVSFTLGLLAASASTAAAGFFADGLKGLTAMTANPATVPELDVPAYAGYWYQMAANSPVLESFEKDCFCATALYGPISAHNVSVHNYCAIASPKGAASIVDGYAWQPDPTTAPGQLKVLFNDEANAAPFPAPYWILALGPRDTNNQYAWSIVSDNLSVSLFVLARNATSYESTYKAEVNTLLKKLGFTGFRAPIDVYQGSDCVYDAK